MGNYSTTFYNNARHTGDHVAIAKTSTSNGILNWNSITESIVASSAPPNGIVYVGSWDKNVYALNANTGTKVWSYTTGDKVDLLPHRSQWDRLRWKC